VKDYSKIPPRVAHQPTLTKVVVDPRLPYRAIFMDWNKFDPADVRRYFEDGWIIIFDNVDVPACDFKGLQSLPVWPDSDREIKKAKVESMLRPMTVQQFSTHPLNKFFPGDFKKATWFQQQLHGAIGWMGKVFKRIFSPYTFTGTTSHSWRLVETFPEILHCDSYYQQDDELCRVRMFYNYDNIPRIWNTTYQAHELTDMWWDKLNIMNRAHEHPNVINAILNGHGPWNELPRHQIFFAPKTLWICDSQLVSHEIVYGRRGWAHTYAVLPGSLEDPEKSFLARMRTVIKRRVGAPKEVSQ
jgi:hypothetical protein